ncbi:11531_t:CDS:2, partial [Scutellospora calospora]
IILALKPFNVVENKAFQNIIKKLDPFYQVPKCKAIYNLAISQFYEQKNLIKNYLSNIINIFQFKGSYTREIIADKIYNLLKEFEIEAKVILLTTDNKQFNKATIELSSQSYPTITHTQIILLVLRNDLKQDKGENFQLQYVVNTMLSKFIEYFNLITESLHISAFLNSRYKKYCFPYISIEEILTSIREKIDQQLPLIVTKPKKLS